MTKFEYCLLEIKENVEQTGIIKQTIKLYTPDLKIVEISGKTSSKLLMI